MAEKHKTIPLFIPHLGCPNDCVFCNQRKISGRTEFQVEHVREEIETALSTMPIGAVPEIAFFGGSFTGIDRALMVYLLDLAQTFVNEGRVSGIRMSTRPDYISDEILDILSAYKISAIELGIQSMDDVVLSASRRGHTADQTERACALIRSRGFSLVGQMMIGLPMATSESEIATARRIVELGASAARVYPTVVFYETALCEMARSGEYEILSDEQAIERTKDVLKVFLSAGLPLLRIGLCSNEGIRSEDEVYGGASHPALGELCLGELYYDLMCEKLSDMGETVGRDVTVCVAEGKISQACGQKRKNAIRIKEKYGMRSLRFLESDKLSGFEAEIATDI